jgi:hypothetical protein
MEYTPRTEPELRSAMVLTPGDYDFEVVSATEGISKSGNAMITLQLRIFPKDDGSPRLIKDWLVPGSTMGDLKLNRFVHSVGLQSEYFDGALTGLVCEGASGVVRLTIESSEQYGDQNRVKDYVVEKVPGEELAKPEGVPAERGKRARKKANDANQGLQQTYEEQLAAKDDSIPF